MSFTRPEPPYYAVIITSALDESNLDGYAAMDERMAELGRAQPGYLGRESRTAADGRELTVLYYRDAESIAAWKQHPEHLEAQRRGREEWYANYHIEVARVERAYGFTRQE
ncbi:antibiotic biosynthesis monooxygenase [Amycolatopsis sp. SID8362]|uniref:antibiotic biosynthesis monooxygenase family protein n=1 Tax=Amycolatopsis sp. SID8362 TaxID=2690346 RepID=UPI0013703F96|nr:antibiotic biosynthesis monooxygenase [Amycolatopsis sp. SID8362]NBH08186.1 antibiotic biosynthesis monooxygenase [Amycolatopsis sp. SID8362]NED44880.1 antibiotic biosynthesis monooxygenase [Amycolatopsis sp. SID8362]